VVTDSVLLIERLAVNAWPAGTTQLADGWLLRHTPALRLYRRLGFQPSHHYHYRVATP
jgi:GNAT superfamily N-acetyltransferase